MPGQAASGADDGLVFTPTAMQRAHLPLRMGGMGLPSAKAHRHAAYWASWADTVGALREFHPQMLGEAAAMPPSTRQAAYAADWLRSQGFAAPTWASLLDGAAPPHGADADEGGPVAMQKGWQRCAGAAVEKRALEMFFSDLDSASRAQLLSQCGPGASCAMTVLPTGPDFTVPSDEFRILLLRRLRMPLPLAPHRCRGRWTSMGTTGRRALRWGCWRSVLGPWSERRPAFAERPGHASLLAQRCAT